MDAETVARWSAWPAVLCYAASIALRLARRTTNDGLLVRNLWTAGWLSLVVHVLVALHQVHGGSWSAAYEHTAQRTAALVGWNWGGGVWFNLLTAIVWGCDVCRMWFKPNNASRRLNAWDWTIQIYLAFMMLNATVVFGSRPARIVGVLICISLAVLAVRAKNQSQPEA